MNISGNHEYYAADVINWMNYLKKLGFTVLHNSHVNISDNSGGSFCLAGCDDIAGHLLLLVEFSVSIAFFQQFVSLSDPHCMHLVHKLSLSSFYFIDQVGMHNLI